MAERVRAGLFEQRAGVCRVLVMLSFPPISVVGSGYARSDFVPR